MPPKKVTPVKPAAKQTVKSTGARVTKAGAASKKPAGKPATGKKTAAAAGKSKGETSKKEAEKKPVWTPQDEAARRIQTSARGYLARKELKKKKKEKEDYEELMDKLEKDAYIKIAKQQQEEAERQYKKEQEERRQRQEAIKRQKRFLEAAFDGDNDELNMILKEVSDADDKAGVGRDDMGKALRMRHQIAIVECEDANGNTPLSEASSGGNVDTIKFLIDRGADPNTQGQFLRSPLYRAAFAGHLEAVEVLLNFGADPRIYADDGQSPEHVASQAAVKEVLDSWDISQTEKMLEKLELDKHERKEAERKRREAEKNKLEGQIDEIQKEYSQWQKAVKKLTEELNKRIFEHDTAAGQGFDRPEVTLQAVHDAEDDLVKAQLELEKVREKLQQARLELREQMTESAKSGDGDDLPGLKVMVRELDDVLFRDVGNKMKDSGKWPLIIDPSQQASTFLRYRDTNYINCLNPKDVEPEKIRLALLGAVRFGKPFVMDMMEVDMFDTVSDRFDEIKKGLMSDIIDRSILQEEKYSALIKDSDGVDYQKNRFNDYFTQHFKFFILTKNPFPSEDLMNKTYVIRVHMPS